MEGVQLHNSVAATATGSLGMSTRRLGVVSGLTTVTTGNWVPSIGPQV